MVYGGYLSHRRIVVAHPYVLSVGMLHGLAVASLLVGVALRLPAEGIGDTCFEHRLAVVLLDGVCTRGLSSVGEGDCEKL